MSKPSARYIQQSKLAVFAASVMLLVTSSAMGQGLGKDGYLEFEGGVTMLGPDDGLGSS